MVKLSDSETKGALEHYSQVNVASNQAPRRHSPPIVYFHFLCPGRKATATKALTGLKSVEQSKWRHAVSVEQDAEISRRRSSHGSFRWTAVQCSLLLRRDAARYKKKPGWQVLDGVQSTRVKKLIGVPKHVLCACLRVPLLDLI
jgi:hypothetical protein